MTTPASSDSAHLLAKALWRIYNRPANPRPWAYGGNLPWNDPAFSERMLREHLDQTHGAASRTDTERAHQIQWLWRQLNLYSGSSLLDVTCGPGLYAVALAEQGLLVTGVDFAPASIRYARNLAEQKGVADRCTFIEADVRGYDFGTQCFDAAVVLYGQLAVMSIDEAQALLTAVGRALKPGARLVLELLDQERVDKTKSSWWYTDNSGLWGDTPYLHLGERRWLADEQLSMERFYIVQLETGHMDEIILCDQTYSIASLTTMLHTAGFPQVTAQPNGANLPLYDAPEWIMYTAVRAS
ncbi:MAG: class I SAM-dependent methyltransferase [Anaerolineales bacterium]|nr:class I SAM-dependent methyltransferase [Anaerolineales bacterium]